MSRTILTQNETYALSALGTSLQAAYDNLFANYDLAGYSVIVNCPTGSYAPLAATGSLIGQHSPQALTFAGDVSTPSNCHIDNQSAGGNALSATYGAAMRVTGFKLTAAQSGAVAVMGGQLSLGQMDFGACGWAQMNASGHGIIELCSASYGIVGPADYFALSEHLSSIYVLASLASFSATTAYLHFAHASQCSVVDFSYSGFAGSGYGATGMKYYAESNSIISTNAQPVYFLPGNIVGVCITGGQYV